MRETFHNLRLINVRKTAATALWFSSFKLFKKFKHFRQIPAAGTGIRKPMTITRTEVLIETSEILIIKRSRTFVRSWCEDCGREVGMLPIPEAALLTGYDAAAIRSLMENRHVHFRYLKAETPYICLRTLCLFQYLKG
jgi:hypothetical protein